MALSGKIVLIFGGSSGMGKSAAKFVLKEGGQPWIIGRDEAKLEIAKQEISKEDPTLVRTSALDCMDEASVKLFFESIAPGSINHIVCTLGPSAGCSSIEGEAGIFGLRRQLDLKFFGQMIPASYGAEKVQSNSLFMQSVLVLH